VRHASSWRWHVYALLLLFSDDPKVLTKHVSKVQLDTYHTLLSNYDAFVVLPIFVMKYFLCRENGACEVRWSGMVLFKGNAGDGKKIVGTKTIVWFDPKQYNKCDEAVENDE
jgi:hypothetical protein